MPNLKIIFTIIVLLLGSILFSETFFVINQVNKALVLQFGKEVRVHESPGLKVKIPFVQDVFFFDNRLLHYNLSEWEVNAADQKRLLVDLFLRYKIVDVLKFYKTVGVNVVNFENRLKSIISDNMQEVIARFPLMDMLSEKRSAIMEEIHLKTKKTARKFGVEVKDVRISRADLPTKNSNAVIARMQSERRKEAKQFRAEGEELGKVIIAEADKDSKVIISSAKRKASIILGKGDAKASAIYASAYNQDKKFFQIYRTMEAYKVVINPKDTTMVLSPQDSEFLQYFVKNK